jgi:6-phosphofructokinase 1
MGRNAGYLALHIAVATGAETALIPEKDFDLQRDVIDPVKTAKTAGKKNHIIIVAEGVDIDVVQVAKQIEKETGMSTRASILGHIQRGGNPTCRDRVTASQMGQKAIELLSQGKTNRVVCVKDGKITDMDINEGLALQRKAIDEEEFKLSQMLAF